MPTVGTLQFALEANASKFSAEMGKASAQITLLDKKFTSSVRSVGGFADSVGRVSTTLARSADAFNLPIGALRTLDDVMDVAEIGFNNLSKSAAGFNAASVGVAGAALAIGSAIGSWLRTFPAVAEAADNLAAKLYKIFAASGTIKESFTAAETEKIRASFARVQGQLVAQTKEQIKAGLAAGKSLADLSKEYKNASPEVQKFIDGLKKQEEAQKKATAEAERAAAAIKAYVDALPGGANEAARIDLITTALTRFGDSITTKGLTRVAQDLKELGIEAKDTAEAIADIPDIEIGGNIATQISDASMLQTLMRDVGLTYEEAAAAMGKLDVETKSTTDSTFRWEDALESLHQTFQLLGVTADDVFSKILTGILSGMAAFEQFQKATSNTQKALIGLQAGASAFQSGSVLGGAATGAAFGAGFGPVGAVIGAAVGGLLGLFGGMKKDAEKLKKAKDEAVNAFVSAFDEWKRARSELAGLGAEGVNAIIGASLGPGGEFTGALTSAANAAAYVAASFAALRASGMSTADALAALSPSLDAISQNMDKFAGTAAAGLVAMANFSKANKPLFDFTKGLGQTAQALAGFGMLTQELANSISADMGAAIDKMVAGGLTLDQALALTAQDLYNLQQAALRGGVVLDEHTQGLIDAAEAAGLFVDLEDPMQRLINATEAVVVAMGTMIRLMGGAVPQALQDMIDAFNRAQRQAPTRDGGGDGTSTPGPPPPGGPRGPRRPDRDRDRGGPRNFQWGSGGFRDFGSGTAAMLHGIEAVVRPADLGNLVASNVPSSVTVNVLGAQDPRRTAEEVTIAIERQLFPRLNTALRASVSRG